jgi:hypothetical protein
MLYLFASAGILNGMRKNKDHSVAKYVPIVVVKSFLRENLLMNHYHMP